MRTYEVVTARGTVYYGNNSSKARRVFGKHKGRNRTVMMYQDGDISWEYFRTYDTDDGDYGLSHLFPRIVYSY